MGVAHAGAPAGVPGLGQAPGAVKASAVGVRVRWPCGAGVASSGVVHVFRRRGVLVDCVTVAMSVPGSCRCWQRACLSRCRVFMVPVCGDVGDSGCCPGRGGACCNTSAPLARAAGAGEAGFMTETTWKTCLPCCCAWMPMRWPLTWRPRRWRARHARPACWPRGGTAGNGRSGCAAGAHTAAAAAGALPVLPPHPRLAAVLVRAAPRGRHRGHLRRGGPAMAGHGHRPVAAALGVPAGTVRGWLRRLRAHAWQLRAHAIC